MNRDISLFLNCPFTIVADTREQKPYDFLDIKSNKDEGNKTYIVKVEREALPVGDYSIRGMESKIIIERKSKADLFQSILKRDNFISRLKKMDAFSYAAIIVEADLEEIATRPPEHTKLSGLSVTRTIFSWDMQYKSKWWCVRGRRMAEKLTFRLLQTMYRHETQRVTRGPKTYEF